MTDPTNELLQLSQELLDSIATGDWATYARLCDADLSAFEPEARGQRVMGLDFHRYYFDLGAPEQPRHTTIVDPQVRLLGQDVALITYIRLVQAQTPVPNPAPIPGTRPVRRIKQNNA